jgi:hypothetical protein
MLNFRMAPVYTEFLNELHDSQALPPSKRAGDVAGVCPISEKLGISERSGVGTGPDGITDISWSAAYPLITSWMLKVNRRVYSHHPLITPPTAPLTTLVDVAAVLR